MTVALLGILLHFRAEIGELFAQRLEQGLQAFRALLVQLGARGFQDFRGGQLELVIETLAGLFQLGQLFIMMAQGRVMLGLERFMAGIEPVALGRDRFQRDPQAVALLDHTIKPGQRLTRRRQFGGSTFLTVAPVVAFAAQPFHFRVFGRAGRVGLSLQEQAASEHRKQDDHAGQDQPGFRGDV